MLLVASRFLRRAGSCDSPVPLTQPVPATHPVSAARHFLPGGYGGSLRIRLTRESGLRG